MQCRVDRIDDPFWSYLAVNRMWNYYLIDYFVNFKHQLETAWYLLLFVTFSELIVWIWVKASVLQVLSTIKQAPLRSLRVRLSFCCTNFFSERCFWLCLAVYGPLPPIERKVKKWKWEHLVLFVYYFYLFAILFHYFPVMNNSCKSNTCLLQVSKFLLFVTNETNRPYSSNYLATLLSAA